MKIYEYDLLSARNAVVEANNYLDMALTQLNTDVLHGGVMSARERVRDAVIQAFIRYMETITRLETLQKLMGLENP